jgi:hypothetical protein
VNMIAYRDAIASIESDGSGGYDALGPKTKGDRAYGRYQVMGKNIPQWTKAALGKSMTPEQFLKDPAAQDAVFDHRFGGYVQKYGPEKAARAWFGGEGAINNPKAKDVLGTSIATYGSKFMGKLGGMATPSAVPTLPASAGGALVPIINKPADAVAAVFDSLAPAPAVPSYATQVAEIQNAPVPVPGGGDQQDAWLQMTAGAIEDDAQTSRRNAVANFFGEEAVPQIQIPDAIEASINRYLAQLS